MYVVTFKEHYKHNYVNDWVASSREYENLDEVKEFVEFLYEEENRDVIKDIHVYRADELKYTVTAKVAFKEE